MILLLTENLCEIPLIHLWADLKKKGTWLCSCDQTPTCTTAVLLCSLISTQLINQSAALFGVC